MYESLVWFDEPCSCALCQHLRESFIAAYHAVRAADNRRPSFHAVVNAASVVGETAEQVHREHRPELYVNVQALNIVSGTAAERETTPSTSPQRAPYHPPNKVLVCDHCMAHGLSCNEASVCDQCASYGQPCVHRWCSQSPTSKQDCPNPRCHYAHMDAIPHVEGEPKWILFRGNLPAHLHRGRLPSLAMAGVPQNMDPEEWKKTLNKRQEDGYKIFAKAVEDKTATWAGYYIECCCNAN